MIHDSEGDLQEDIVTDYEDYYEHQEEWLDEEDEEDDEEKKVREKLTPEQIEIVKEEIEELREIYNLAITISANSKGECLVKALRLGFEHMKEMGAPQKSLIFTESRRTQEYLYQLLEANGYEGDILLFNGSNNDPKSKEIYNNWIEKYKGSSRVTGSKTADKRQALVEYFKDNAKIMIATEAAAEGINLQFCSLIVNYDLPWNPQRVEQRIGRCHRYGQKYDVVVVNFINKSNRADQRVYELLDQKFNLFKGVFGASDEVLGSIGNGVDFEKRILAIYKQCRTTEEIDSAFDMLQDEMRDSIEDSMKQTRVSLFENFDEEVIEKLKIREGKDSEFLDRYNQLLWSLTCGSLKDRIVIKNENRHEFVLHKSPCANIQTGLYALNKNDIQAYNYRISHPLAQWAVSDALKKNTPDATIEFDYSKNSSIISIIKQNVGNSGYLTMRVIRYSSLKEEEEHIVLSAVDMFGNEMPEGFAERLLAIPSRITSETEDIRNDKLDEKTQAIQDTLIQSLEIRDSDVVTAEIVKIENWAEDNRKALQQRLSELDKVIDEKNNEFITEKNIRKKLDIQKEKDALLEKRDAAWQEYDQKREELKADKNKVISTLYELADGKTEVVDEFTIKWKII